jgi:hypothetical protein
MSLAAADVMTGALLRVRMGGDDSVLSLFDAEAAVHLL